jgi:hypothetical protein
MPLKKSQIGRCGEILVQYLLLLRGIESAPMTTDAGVDLVTYSHQSSTPKTIQVKTNLKAKPAGGKGRPALDWWIDEHTPAQLFALVDLSTQRVWLFTIAEIAELSQQKSSGRYHLYMYLDVSKKIKKLGRPSHVDDFADFLLANRADVIFGAHSRP